MSIDEKIQEIMWLVFNYADTMDGFSSKEGESRTVARNEALDIDNEIRQSILKLLEK